MDRKQKQPTNPSGLTHNQAYLIGFGLFSLLLVIAFQSTWSYLWSQWEQIQHGDYAHGILVVAISLWIFYSRLRDPVRYRVFPAGILLIAFFSLTWAASQLMGVRLIENLSLFGIISSTVLCLMGNAGLRHHALALLYLLLALPIWAPFLPLLQAIAAWISYFILQICPFPVIKEGAYITVPAGQFLVAEGCSGLRYLLAALTFAGFYIYLEDMRLKKACLFVLLAVSSAILANAIRIVTVIIAGNMTAMQHPWVDDHMALGWGIFAVMLLPVFYLGGKLSSYPDRTRSDDQLMVNLSQRDQKERTENKGKWVYPVLLLACLLGPLTLKVLNYVEQTSLSALSEHGDHVLPEKYHNWQKRLSLFDNENPMGSSFNTADHSDWEQYEYENKAVGFYRAIYHSQNADKEMINVDNFFIDEGRWQPVYVDTITPTPGDTVIETLVKDRSLRQYLVWSWYESAGRKTHSGLKAKLYELLGRFTGEPDSQASMLVIEIPSVSHDKTGTVSKERENLKDFYLKYTTSESLDK